MIYRLLALNIDGTLIQSNGRLSKSTKDAIEYVQQKGIYVTLVTSRSLPSARKVAKALKLNNYIVTHQGALISDNAEQTLYVNRLTDELTYEIVRFLEGFICQIRIVHEKFSLANKSRLNHNMLAKTVFNSGDPVFYSHQFVEVLSEVLLEEPVSAPKIEVYFEDKKDCLDAKEVLDKMFDEINIVQMNDLRLEVLPEGVNKLNGLLYLAEHLGINRREVVVIGDSLDDKDMIEAAGLGVAMGNAPSELKFAADWVTRSNNQDGVAYMVKEHFRKQQPIEFLRKMNIIK
ncbi:MULTISPECIES: Cof-type HAD-IIB family hydrolase [unclassified Niallia]|uniref:Cof-type HAD-IIB family hydrolase n=1 Tax=unclassified Niallia TaxID=2837522 RepID=UPI001EDA1606|nr:MULTISPECIES: Cof-type HAD-IIB family hydrolase [unclassified Niallia]MDL0436801.1 Cof-type HAD-IIB family hydrolase [Niallia sp. SS-2023]UPO88287.1 Cof-type HAD-IIB family hydrolase [Niallia sp. Man26]